MFTSRCTPRARWPHSRPAPRCGFFFSETCSACRAGAPSSRACRSFGEELGADFGIVNGENAADGTGITAKLAEKLLAAGADVLTTGNHVWRHKDIVPVLEQSDRVIRPANLTGPGSGLTVVESRAVSPSPF